MTLKGRANGDPRLISNLCGDLNNVSKCTRDIVETNVSENKTKKQKKTKNKT